MRSVSMVIFSIGSWLLGSLAILSAMFGILFFAFLAKDPHAGGAPLFLLAVTMFLPAAALATAILTAFLPTPRGVKLFTVVFGSLATIPVLLMCMIHTKDWGFIYVVCLICVFMIAWGHIVLTSRSNEQTKQAEQDASGNRR